MQIEAITFSESELTEIVIPSSVEVLGPGCFHQCRSLISVTFESISRLVRIEASAFSESGLNDIIIPSSVEVIDPGCFS
jgi:hypothetical protein